MGIAERYEQIRTHLEVLCGLGLGHTPQAEDLHEQLLYMEHFEGARLHPADLENSCGRVESTHEQELKDLISEEAA